MFSISFKVAYPIVIAGLFIVAVFVALNYQTLNPNFYIILLLVVAYIFLFGFATGQNFASPIKKFLQRADELSKGDLSARFYSENKDELGELAKTFNKIAEDLAASKERADTLEKSVDMKVQARTQTLEETINALEQKVRNRTLELQRIVGESEKLKSGQLNAQLTETEIKKPKRTKKPVEEA